MALSECLSKIESIYLEKVFLKTNLDLKEYEWLMNRKNRLTNYFTYPFDSTVLAHNVKLFPLSLDCVAWARWEKATSERNQVTAVLCDRGIFINSQGPWNY